KPLRSVTTESRRKPTVTSWRRDAVTRTSAFSGSGVATASESGSPSKTSGTVRVRITCSWPLALNHTSAATTSASSLAPRLCVIARALFMTGSALHHDLLPDAELLRRAESVQLADAVHGDVVAFRDRRQRVAVLHAVDDGARRRGAV